MIKVPVTIGFDSTKIIGEMLINEKELPFSNEFCFALGVRVKDFIDDGKGNKLVTDFDLVEVSVVDNYKYMEYLTKEFNVK